MPRLTRNTTPDGSCKYGLVRMDKIRQMDEGQRVSVLRVLENLKGLGVYEEGKKGSTEEFFAIKLKDIHAAPAFLAYAKSVMDYDGELFRDVSDLALQAKQRKDSRHPTV
jgi:hypothetical protein